MSDVVSEITLQLDFIKAALGLLLVIIQLAAEIRRKRQGQACSSTSRRFNRPTRRISVKSIRFVAGAVLAILLVVISAGLYFGLPWSDYATRPRSVITGAGDLREAKLCDHTLNINENTSLVLTEDRSDCRATLKSGEAAFLTGGKRPLTVFTPHVSIRGDDSLYGVKTSATGTDITTSSEGDETSIQCLTPDGHIKTLTLHADQSVRVGNDCGLQLGRVANIQPPNLYPHEELQFRNARLVDAIGDFNEYYQQPIRLDAESLSDEKISGAFNPLDQHTLLEYLKQVYGLRAVRTKDGGMRLVGPPNFAATQKQ